MRTRFLYPAVAALAILAACSQPVPLDSKPATMTIGATGTLSTSECELATAPLMTQLVNTRRQAAQLLRANRLSVDQAVSIQGLGDVARGALDAACPKGARAPEPNAMAIATSNLARMRTTLEIVK